MSLITHQSWIGITWMWICSHTGFANASFHVQTHFTRADREELSSVFVPQTQGSGESPSVEGWRGVRGRKVPVHGTVRLEKG